MASITGADHHSITVEDLDRAVAFYRDTFDLEVVVEGQIEQGEASSDVFSELAGLEDVANRSAHLEVEEGVTLELFEYQNPEGGRIDDYQPNDVRATHFCFRTDDLQGFYESLEDDVDFVSEPVTFPSGVEAVYFRDPEGNLMEILSRPE